MIYSVVLITATQHSDSVTIHLYILFNHGLSKDTECSSLCCTMGPRCLSILCIGGIYSCYPSLSPSLLQAPPLWQPMVYSCSMYSLIILFISIRFIAMSPFLFLIFIICVFFGQVCLTKDLSILLMYLKNQLLVSLILLFFYSPIHLSPL